MKELVRAIQQSIEDKPFEVSGYQDLYSTLREIGEQDKAYSIELAKWLSQRLEKGLLQIFDSAAAFGVSRASGGKYAFKLFFCRLLR